MQPFAPRLLRWFETNRRDLPWRRTRDPWAIWVSEVMLQQTRVEAVRAPYERFLVRFPTPAAFAGATDDELLAAWRGLGYYRRARLLREGARQVVAGHGGQVPDNRVALAELPGIGAYTLGAVASIAFGLREVAIDGNVERVMARHRGLLESMDTAAARRQVREIVTAWLPAERPGDFNQALMELGATVCKPGTPDCGHCPLAADCVALAKGLTAVLPVRKAPRTAVDVQARVILVTNRGQALGHRLAVTEANAGQIELPGGGMLNSCDADDLAGALRRLFDTRAVVGPEITTVRHAITHHRITLHAHAATLRTQGRLRWFPLDEATPWTTPSRKVFRSTLSSDTTRQA